MEQSTEKLKNIFSGRRKTSIAAAVLAVIAIAIVVYVSGPKKSAPYDTGGPNITSALDAFAAAKSVAQGWHHDAVLSKIDSNRISTSSQPISEWRFIFISPGALGKGFLVAVSTVKVTEAREINYSGTGAPVPENIISQGEAIDRIHGIRGYENAAILGIQAVYDPIKHAWFWAAKTPRGTVSIEAK